MANEKKQNQNSEEPLQYSLFGNPYSQQVSAPKEEVEKEVVKTNPYSTSAPYNPQPSMAAGYGAQTQGTIGIKGRPTTSTDPNAIQNVGGSALAPNKAEAVKDPVNYVEKYRKLQAEANKQYTPGTGGKGVSGWINRNFGSPSGGANAQNTKGNRQTIQNIAAITDVLRHAANLYYTSKGATPQNIQSQVAMNQAKWQAEDALEQQREKAQQEMELKRREQQRKEDKDERTLAQGDLRNQIALGNFKIASERNDRDAEMHPYNLAAKAAGVEQTKANTERTKVETELAPKKFEEQKRHNAVTEANAKGHLALGWANHRLSQWRASRSGGGSGRTGNNLMYHGFTSGWYGTLGRSKNNGGNLSNDEIASIYNVAVKNKWIQPVVKTAGAMGGGTVTLVDMRNAISNGIAYKDGKGQHLAHFLVDNYDFEPEDQSVWNMYTQADNIFAQREAAKKRSSTKTSSASDFGGTTIRKKK